VFLRPPVSPEVPRWIWVGAGGVLLVAALVGWLLARQLGGETVAEAERVRASDSAPVAAAN
jgi:high-affinity Fe2+/Pb2+ permease